MDRTSKQNISKDIEDFHSTVKQLDLTDIYETLPTIAEYPFFSSAGAVFFRMDHMLGHKTTLIKF